MNRNSHRVVFNRARGQLMAVGEGARSVCKSGRGQGIRAVVMATLLLAGVSQAQIVADPNAPGGQRPTVLNAPNGTPLVNIQTPSAAGVSRNTYRQFDVNASGAILNNSRTSTQTQLGGWVPGNPWLATGGARVILNEVNSTHPSQLNGWVEVAGQRAEVVIANPAGIQVNGAGFINASGVTLTTGAPVFNGGSLESYRVQGGQVQIAGNGLGARGADYTAILARAVEVNAGLWANRLKVVTGANTVDAASHAPTGATTPSGNTPTFALDVAQLGGMYAGQIHLIGTEAGLGVNNRGVMGATAGNLVLEANGQLTNQGRLYGDQVAIQSPQVLNEGAGAVIAARERLNIGAQHIVNRDGALLFSTGSLHVGGTLDGQHQASGQAQTLHNRSALIESLGDMALDTRELHNLNDHYSMTLEPGTPTPALYLLHDGVAYTQDQLGLNFPALNLYDDQAGWSVLLPSTQYPFASFPADVASWATPTWFGAFTIDRNQAYTWVNSGEESYAIPHPYPREHGIWGRFGLTPPPAQPTYGGPACGAAGESFVFCTGEQRSQYQAHQSAMVTYNAQHNAAVATLHQQIDAYNASATSRTLINWTVIDASQTVYTPVVSQSAPAQIRVGGNLSAHFATQAINDKSQILVGGTASLSGAALQNIEAQGTERTEVRGTSVYSYYHNDCSLCNDDRYYQFAPYVADTMRTVTVPITRFQTQALTASGTLPEPSPVETGGLFQVTSGSTSGYLIETDPRFTDHRQWLGTDYLLRGLSYDPVTIQKRLGDGFYEQKIIREQVAQLTGQRYLGDHTSDDAQYRALMDAGVTFAQAHELRPGVALTVEQVAVLTSDIVWLVEGEVTLPDGSRTRVLVPQVYVVPRAGDLNGSGTLIAAKDIDIRLSGDLVNSGTLAGRQITQISAENLHNLGVIGGQSAAIQARRDITSAGGMFKAQDALVLDAGRDLNLATTAASTDAGTSTRTTLDRVAALYVSNLNGVLVASAGRDMGLGGVDLRSAGDVELHAGRDLSLDTVRTESSDTIVWDAHNRLGLSQSQEVGTQISGNAIGLSAGQDIQTRAASVQAQGDLSLSAGRDIGMQAGQASQGYDEAHRIKSSGFLSSKTTTTQDSRHDTVAQASELGGQTVTLQAGQDVNIRGSQVIGDAGTTVVAGRDIQIEAAQTRHSESHFQETMKSGWGAMGGISYGKSQHSTDQQVMQTGAQASTVGAIAGDVTLIAGQNYRQTGSDVLAPGGDVNIVAQDIAIVEARQTHATRTEEKFKSSGISVNVSAPVISAVQGIASTAQAIGDTKDGRMQALGAATLALQGKQAIDGIKNIASATNLTQAAGVSVSISIGSSKSESVTQTQADTARGSSVMAGGSVNLVASGAGTTSDILVRGSDITAGDTVRLMADGDVTLQAARNDSEEHSRQSSKSGSIGISLGSQTGITVSASRGKGQGDGHETTYSNTHINAGNLIQIDSGGDTTLKGATAQAEQIVVKVGGNLSIESLQDTATYNERSQNAGFSVTVGPTPGGSISAGKTKIASDYQSVTEQSGLKAGDEGFQVSVAGHTDLKGGAITSSQAAIDKGRNRVETGSLSTTTLTNQSSASADSSGVNLSSDMLTQGKYGIAKAVVGNAMNHATESTYSAAATKPVVSTGKIVITNEDRQHELTGKTSPETIASLNREASQVHQAVQKQDIQGMKQSVEADRVIKMAAYQQVTVHTDAAYKALFKTGVKFYKVTCGAMPEECLADPSKVVMEEVSQDEAKRNGKVLAVNGILNETERAGQLAYQNVPVDKDFQKPDEVHLMHIPPAGTTLGEVLVAGYEKLLAPTLGYTDADVAYADMLQGRGEEPTLSLGHSRGTIVQTNALNISAQEGYRNENLTVIGVGGAVKEEAYRNAATSVSGRPGEVTFTYMRNDPVSVIAAGNPGDATAAIKEFWSVMFSSNSAHSCYGTGAAGCTTIENPVPGGPTPINQQPKNIMTYQGGNLVRPQGVQP